MTAAPSPGLPPDLTSRPLIAGDARAVYEVMAEQELHDLGTIEIEEADIVGDWQRPSFDISASTVGVFDGGRLVGYAEISRPERGDAAVRPTYRGRGIGSWLAEWMQQRGRSRGAAIVGMPVPEHSAGDRLLSALGYHVRWTSWVLELPRGSTIAERTLPAGYDVRAATPAQYPAVHDLVEDAFLEWSERERETYEDFMAVTVQRPGFEPWHLRVVLDPDGAVVGAASMSIFGDEDDSGRTSSAAYLSRLAVRRDLRGRGLAQALMVDAFAQARAHGSDTCELSTDSRTGALGLYQKVGMDVTSTWLHRAINLS